MSHNLVISRWLLVILISIVLIVAVGGITRLTDSGLSMVDWEPIKGIIPPTSKSAWEKLFLEYQNFPEFKIKNSYMELSDFKAIFWWEYIHRIIGRIIGLIVLIPYTVFTIKGIFSIKQKKEYFFILMLVILQGIIGWAMVKSGLNEKTFNGVGVSHYWLTLHLTLAFITFSYTLWQYLRLKFIHLKSIQVFDFNYTRLIYFLVFAQIILGALLAGLDGGMISNRYPLINGEFYPYNATFFDFSNPHFLNFAHRWMPLLILLYILFSFKKVYLKSSIYQILFFKIILTMFLFQFLLGVLTVLTSVNIYIAVLHQLGSIVLLASSTVLWFSFSSK
ncbi:MAG: heme A synthase [Pelagibacteraceae bacterium TMED124]|nr:hypothetical protein [Candidatus Neomarinimicrobiota bacterium]RPG18575.1 MAG: heme A synthase [Pelagibacteraceae bacterium TMED124]